MEQISGYIKIRKDNEMIEPISGHKIIEEKSSAKVSDPEIIVQIKSYDELCARLTKVVDALENKLSYIAHPYIEQTLDSKQMEDKVPLANELMGINIRLSNSIIELESLHKRIEL